MIVCQILFVLTECPLLVIPGLMNCLGQRGTYTRECASIPQLHHRQGYTSFIQRLQSCSEAEVFTTLSLLNPAFCAPEEGGEGSQAFPQGWGSRAAQSSPCPWLWCTLSSPSLTQLIVPTWHARNFQNKDRHNSDLLTNTSLPNTRATSPYSP